MEDGAVVIRAGSALVGRGLERVSPAAIVVRNGTIEAVGNADRVDAPIEASVIDAPELTLLPGFIDAHVHIGFYRPESVVRGGVTTARDLGWPPESIHPLVRASRAPDFRGPTLVAAGPMLTAPGGYPSQAAWAPEGTARLVASARDAPRAVDRTIEEGATIIKVALHPAVGPTLDLDTLRAIVQRAHERARKVSAHVYGLDELNKALAARIDELAHVLMSTESVPHETTERMVRQGVVVVPTLSVRFGDDRAVAIDNLRRFVRAGGRAIYGTDLGNEGPEPGIDEREVRAMGDAGMTPRQIVTSATVESADWLALVAKGSLEAGRDADVIGVRGDPLHDARALTMVELVVRRGKRVR